MAHDDFYSRLIQALYVTSLKYPKRQIWLFNYLRNLENPKCFETEIIHHFSMIGRHKRAQGSWDCLYGNKRSFL